MEELDLNLHRIDKVCCLLVDKLYIGHDNIGIIFSFIENSQFMPMLYGTHQILIGCSSLIQEGVHNDWFIEDNNKKTTLHINMPYCQKV